jgi:predicted phage terminase large subunit-like protein
MNPNFSLDEVRVESSAIREMLRSLVDRLRGKRRAAHPDTSLLEWGQTYLPRHFRKAPSLMHRWLSEQLHTATKSRGTKLNLIGPRGGAKSTLGTLAHVLRCAVEVREPYIWIVSDTRSQANAHLENVKAELLDNAALARAYPDAVGEGDIWRSGKAQLRNGVVIEAYGTGQRIRGRRVREQRPTLIVCDDIQNDDHIESARQRELSLQWFRGTLLKAGNRRTNYLNLATALHHDALALVLHRTPGWQSRIFRAVERWPDAMSLWHEWERRFTDLTDEHRTATARQFYETHQSELEAGAVLLWPEEEDLVSLMAMRVEGGNTAFEREKQGSPVNPDACEWPETYFGEGIWFHRWPENLRLRVIALDPSKGSESRHGDYSAFVLLGVDDQGVCFVEADLARRPIPQMVAEGAELCRRFRPDAIGFEANQFQELLGSDFVAEFQKQGVVGLQPWTLHNHVKKLMRIRRLSPLLAQGRLRFLAGSAGTRLLVEQLKFFPCADHDDGPDALEMAVRLAGELMNQRPGDGLGDRLLLTN